MRAQTKSSADYHLLNTLCNHHSNDLDSGNSFSLPSNVLSMTSLKLGSIEKCVGLLCRHFFSFSFTFISFSFAFFAYLMLNESIQSTYEAG